MHRHSAHNKFRVRPRFRQQRLHASMKQVRAHCIIALPTVFPNRNFAQPLGGGLSSTKKQVSKSAGLHKAEDFSSRMLCDGSRIGGKSRSKVVVPQQWTLLTRFGERAGNNGMLLMMGFDPSISTDPKLFIFLRRIQSSITATFFFSLARDVKNVLCGKVQ